MSEIFEENQTFLQSNVEKLSGFLETEVHKLCDKERSSQIKTVVDFCQQASKLMIKTVQEGKEKNKWNFRSI